ncbi:ABC transporter permease [Kurthia huakuii]|uniref:ABC transporter permease n=1 Tax=Kurthia huakuii TaxID=1421019 RepID=UPI000496D552|nr:hypothetical protein [Kurthia huakuii]MBM7699451.1 ABC-2 type transport system permease protein [Kurthia huakuii]
MHNWFFLWRFYMKQQRLKIAIWLLSIVGVTLIIALAYPNVYDTPIARQTAQMTMQNPAMIAMLGPGYVLKAYIQSVAVVFANEMLLFTAIVVALMNSLLIVRMTRADEEDGRLEVLRAHAIGRIAPGAAALAVVVVVDVLLALLLATGLYAVGNASFTWQGSLLYGTALAALGFVFAGVTFMLAQLVATARSALMWSIFLLLASYLVRAVGDRDGSVLSQLSPFGWLSKTVVFWDNRWWPVLALLVCAVAFCAMGFVLYARRDMDASLIAPRKGRASAHRSLTTPLGLVLRMQRVPMIAWVLGLAVLAAAYGSVLGDLQRYYDKVAFIREFLGVVSGGIVAQFIVLLMQIMALISTIPIILLLLRLYHDETSHFIDHAYSRTVSRGRMLSTYLVVGVLWSIVNQFIIGTVMWQVGKNALPPEETFATVVGAALIYLPAIWSIVGMVVVLLGWLPRAIQAVWLYFAFCFLVMYMGDLLKMPHALKQLSVFNVLPHVPVDSMTWGVTFVVSVVALALALIGYVGYRRRDLAT